MKKKKSAAMKSSHVPAHSPEEAKTPKDVPEVFIPSVAYADPHGGSFVRIRNTTRSQRLNVVILMRTVPLPPGGVSEPLDEKLLRQPHPARLLSLGLLERVE